MKKHIFSILFILIISFGLTACKAGETDSPNMYDEESDIVTTEEPSPKPTIEPTTNTPEEAAHPLSAFQVTIDDTLYKFPMWYEDFIALGWECMDDVASELISNSCCQAVIFSKDGIEVNVGMANLSMDTVTVDKAMIYGIRLDENVLKDANWEARLPNGIICGVSTKEDILAVYGQPAFEFNESDYYKFVYKFGGLEEYILYVSKETNILNEVELYNMILLDNPELNIINPDVPESVNDYAAPEKLSDSLYDFTILLEDNLYELPCPLTALLENGFIINEDKSDLKIGPTGSGWVELSYNNITYRAQVKNYSEYAAIVQNCFVRTIKASIFEPKFALTIPENITCGINEEELLKIINNYNYEKEESGDYTYYTIYNPLGSKHDHYTISVLFGKVSGIEVESSLKSY